MNRAAKAAVAAVPLAIASIAACSGARVPAPTKPAPITSPTDPARITQEAVLAAYTGMWDDYQKDLLTANWQNPTSVNHAIGDALMTLENTLAVDGHNGWIGKGQAKLSPSVRKLSPADKATTAEVVDCVDLSQQLLYVAKTGALQNSTPGGRHLVVAELVLKGDAWMVSSLESGQVGSC